MKMKLTCWEYWLRKAAMALRCEMREVEEDGEMEEEEEE